MGVVACCIHCRHLVLKNQWIGHKVPLLIETHQSQDLYSLQDLAQQLSQRVYVYSSAQRLSLHLAAVFACNFSN